MATESSMDREVDVATDVSLVRALAARFKRRLTEWIDDRRHRGAHDRLIEDVKRKGGFGELLEALGVTPEQFEKSSVPPIVAAELSQRMRHQLGCDLRLGPMDISALTQECRVCGSWKTCRRWLDSGGSGTGYRDFCPNAEVFDRLRESKTRTVSSRD